MSLDENLQTKEGASHTIVISRGTKEYPKSMDEFYLTDALWKLKNEKPEIYRHLIGLIKSLLKHE